MHLLVSVIIPTKNRKLIIGKSITSVLLQEHVNVEIIVVNDGSDDGTDEYIHQNFPSVILINNSKSMGGAGARNIGIEYANGHYIAFLDSDDEWLPNHLCEKINSLVKYNADGVYGPFFLKDENALKEIKFYNNFPSDFSIADKIASFKTHDSRTSTLVFIKEKLKKIKFDENLQKHQDWDLVINYEKIFKLIYNSTPTAIIHVDSLHSRMSNKLNHNATFYFLKKNTQHFKPKSIFNFCLKIIMRCQGSKDNHMIDKYLNIISSQLVHLSFKDKVIYFLLKNKMLDLNTIRKVKNILFK